MICWYEYSGSSGIAAGMVAGIRREAPTTLSWHCQGAALKGPIQGFMALISLGSAFDAEIVAGRNPPPKKVTGGTGSRGWQLDVGSGPSCCQSSWSVSYLFVWLRGQSLFSFFLS